MTGIDPRAHQVEVWIPLPRNDNFQRVTLLSIDSPMHAEIVEQPSHGNRIAHLSATGPLPASIPVTIRFNVHRVEESADLVEAQRNVPEPRDGTFKNALSPDSLVPINGQILQVSAKVGEAGASPYQQAQAIYNYVIANMSYDKSGKGWGRGDAIYACNVKKGTVPTSIRCSSRLRARAGFRPASRLAFPWARQRRARFPATTAGRNSTQPANGSR